MDYLPVFLRLHARPALVVGGGQVAARKVEWLLKSGARVSVVAPELHAELRTLAASGALHHLAEFFAPGHLDGVELVVAATSERDVNAQVSRAARERRIPVNVVDDPELSTFIFPAIIDRSPIIVAVSSGGQAPVLARRVREQLEALLPAKLGALARFMGDRRARVKEALRAVARRPFWERIVGGTTGSKVLAGDETSAQTAFDRELHTTQLAFGAAAASVPGAAVSAFASASTFAGIPAAARSVPPGEVYLIGAGPGDPDLLTLRALQLLQQADIVLYDRLVPEAVVERARRDAQRIFVGKEPGERAAQERINQLLIHYSGEGLRVARLKGGDPFIFGRGGEEIQALAAHGIPYIVVPGITAALGAAAVAGIPLTHRELSQSVTFVTGHALHDDTLDWKHLAAPHQTVVFYMGAAQLDRIAAQLIGAGAPPDRPAALIEKATLAQQQVLRGSLESIAAMAAAAQVAAPALLIVGDVTAFNVLDALSCAASAESLLGAIA